MARSHPYIKKSGERFLHEMAEGNGVVSVWRLATGSVGFRVEGEKATVMMDVPLNCFRQFVEGLYANLEEIPDEAGA